MRRRKTGYILLTLLVVTGLAGTYHDSLSNQERKLAVNYLNETRTIFLQAVSNLSRQQLDFKPAPGEWSIRNCMEHVARAEASVSCVTLNTQQEPSEPTRHREVRIKDDEVIRVSADLCEQDMNEEFQPIQAGYTTEVSDVDVFNQLRDRNINFIKTTTADLRNQVFRYPVVGVVDSYQFLLMMAAHTQRYTRQIEEIKSKPDFPK